MSFKISFEDAKRILGVFYNCKYNEAIGYIEILHNLKEEDSGLTLKEKIAVEVALAQQAQTLKEA